MKRCPDKRCNAPTVTCRLGEEFVTDCSVWCSGKGNGTSTPADANIDTRLIRLPWSGAALGTTDLPFVTGRGEPKIVAVIGPHNAGKTTLLGLFYQQIGRSGRLGTARFAGSYSLEGWEAIAHALRWEAGVPRFPPHTSSGAGRAPGLLHMAMRDDDERVSDILYADSPGEWFQRWAVDPAAGDAEGAAWLIERASTLLIVADCEALAGEKRGQARSDIIQLVRRVAASRDRRSAALVWTKADVDVPPMIREAVTRAVKLVLPDFAEFETSVVPFEREGTVIDPSASVRAVLEWTIAPLARGFSVKPPPPQGDDPFFAIGATA
jgi:hypothetical protein